MKDIILTFLVATAAAVILGTGVLFIVTVVTKDIQWL
jgi:hypothetical protein